LADTLRVAAPIEFAPEAAGISETADDAACEPIRQEMRELMTANVGLQRSEVSLLLAERELERLTRSTPLPAWRTHNQLLVAGLITKAARRRRESRGGHRRTDYPPASLKREAV
jgi:aspartate oxidase